jgi:LmbE family N-acetylglucosaminyl deacetylase
MDILVLAAHPDDEVLGMGATIKKMSKKNKIHLCVVTEGASAQYEDKKMIEERKKACIKCGKILGINTFNFLDFKDMTLNFHNELEINQALEKIIQKFKPHTIYTTPNHDVNSDHKKLYESTIVASRPYSTTVKKLLCYEIPGTVSFPFQPNIFENINDEFEIKLKGFRCYKSEIRKFPHPRSIKSLETIAIQRGIESGCKKSEAFKLIREIKD